jgi:hypothetical protein
MPRTKTDMSTKGKQKRASKKMEELAKRPMGELEFTEAVNEVTAAIAEDSPIELTPIVNELDTEDEIMLAEHQDAAIEEFLSNSIGVEEVPTVKKAVPKSRKKGAVKKPVAKKAGKVPAAAAAAPPVMTIQMGSHILGPAVYTAADMAESTVLPSIFSGATGLVRSNRAAEVEAALTAATGGWAKNMNWWQVLLFVFGEGMVQAAAQNQQRTIDSGKDVIGGDGLSSV